VKSSYSSERVSVTRFPAPERARTSRAEATSSRSIGSSVVAGGLTEPKSNLRSSGATGGPEHPALAIRPTRPVRGRVCGLLLDVLAFAPWPIPSRPLFGRSVEDYPTRWSMPTMIRPGFKGVVNSWPLQSPGVNFSESAKIRSSSVRTWRARSRQRAASTLIGVRPGSLISS
jgi:hypothetical protein